MYNSNFDRSTYSLEIKKSEFFSNLTKFIDTLYEFYPLILENEHIIKEVLYESEIVSRASIGRQYDPQVFVEEHASINYHMNKLDNTIFKPLEQKCLEPDIFWYNIGEDDYFIKCDMHQYQKDIINHTFYLFAIAPDFDIKGAISYFDDKFLKNIKYQIDRYLKFRSIIFFCSHKFSRMLLCFDDFLKGFIYESNFDNSLCKRLYSPITTYIHYPGNNDNDVTGNEFYYLSIFYSHILPRVEIEKRINFLIDMYSDMYEYKMYLENKREEAKPPKKVQLITDVYEIDHELDDYLIEQIKKNEFFYKGIEFTYFIDDLLDLLDVLKSKLLSRKQKRYVNDFSTKLVSLIESNQVKNLKKEKVEFKDFFKKLDSKKINIIESKFSKLIGKDLAMFISLAYNDFGILDIRLNDKNGYSSSDFIRLFEENKNIQSVNKHIDSNFKFTGSPADLNPIENQLHSIL